MDCEISAQPGAWAASLLACYLIGGIPFGYLAGRMCGVDLRKEGSGNIGATNALRVLGRKWGIPVFALDVLKGFVPLVVLQVFLVAGNIPADLFLACCAGAAVLGHNFTPYLGFRGGKGMATSAGVLLALIPLALLATLLLWGVVFRISRYVSLGSILASLALPVFILLLYPGRAYYLAAGCFLGLMGIWRHRSNIRRLLEGTENRFEKKKKEPPCT